MLSWLGRHKALIGVAMVVATLIGGAAFVYAYDRGRADLLAQGVRIGGVDVGGLHTATARAKLDRVLVRPVVRPIFVRFPGGRARLGARAARVAVDVRAAVAKALRRSREGSIFTRTWRGLTGGRVEVAITPTVGYSHAAVRGLIRRVARAVGAPAQDARVSYSATGLQSVASYEGRALRAARLRRRIAKAIVTPGARRVLHASTRRIEPAVTTGQLATKYPSVITLDRAAFTLRVFQNLKPTRTYRVAVGQAGLQTPAGLYHVESKQVDPSWYVPHDAWAGSLQGKVIPPGPADPLKARYMGIFAGAGIHGIDPSEYGTIGQAASHGCVRMTIPDVIDLYDRVSVGTPIYIGN